MGEEQRRAGRYALERARGGPAFRRQVWRLRALSVGIAAIYLALAAWRGDLGAPLYGAGAGAFILLTPLLGTLIAPRHLQRWRAGSEGERETAKALRPLAKKGWMAFHDIVLDPEAERPWNIDHIVAGAGGVFLLDTKHYEGRAELIDGTLRLTHPSEPGKRPYDVPLTHFLAASEKGVHAQARWCRLLRTPRGRALDTVRTTRGRVRRRCIRSREPPRDLAH